MTDLDDIPAFLRLTAEERAASWKGRKATTMRITDAKRDYSLPRSIDADGLALFKERERNRAERAKERLAALKQRRRRI